MSRLALALFVAGTALCVVAAIAVLLAVPVGDRPTAAAAVAGVAAVVQAATAIAIVVLTVRLVSAARQSEKASGSALQVASEQANAARDAIGVARDQLEIAERADLHARRDRQLLAVPLLSAEYINHSDFEGESVLQVQVRNEGGSPALGIMVVVGGSDVLGDDPPTGTYEAASVRAETLQPEEEKTIHVSMTAFRAKGAMPKSHERPQGIWKHPFFVVRLGYRALLGQTIAIDYGWFAGAPIGWPDSVWVIRRIRIDLDVEDAEPVDLRF